MENLSELSGYVASTLVLLTFIAKDMRVLRTIAIFSNLAFITYGTIEWLPPVLFLHLVLLPLNIVRLARDRQDSSSHVQPSPSPGRCQCPNFVHRHDNSRPIARSTLADFPQHAEDSAPRLANSTKLVNAEANMKTMLLAIIALLVLTGVAGSAAMIRCTDASGDPRHRSEFAWRSLCSLPLILFEPGRRDSGS